MPQALDVRICPHVAGHCKDANLELRQLCLCLRKPTLVDVGDDDVGPPLRQRQRCRPADAAGGASDYCYFASGIDCPCSIPAAACRFDAGSRNCGQHLACDQLERLKVLVIIMLQHRALHAD